jgi:hypothetical protein
VVEKVIRPEATVIKVMMRFVLMRLLKKTVEFPNTPMPLREREHFMFLRHKHKLLSEGKPWGVTRRTIFSKNPTEELLIEPWLTASLAGNRTKEALAHRSCGSPRSARSG